MSARYIHEEDKFVLLSFRISKQTILFALLLLSFLPLLSPSGVSINYFFILLLLVCSYVKLEYLSAYVMLIILASCLSYFFGLLTFGIEDNDYLRQFLSFGAYIAVLSILLIKLPYSENEIFLAVIVVSSVYSLWVLAYIIFDSQFTLSNLRHIKTGLREYVLHWPQRFPVVMMAALLFSFVKMFKSKKYILPFVLISACLFLTFTRSIYLSVAIGFCYLFFYAIFYVKKEAFRRNFRNYFFRFGVMLAVVAIVLSFNETIHRNLLSIFAEAIGTIVSFLSGSIEAHRTAGSDAIRMFFWKRALEIWSQYPLFGTGFVGIYQFSDIGSTHNQYLDILLRTGLVGLSLYLLLWVKLLKFYWIRNPEITAGMLAIFTYGFFHESTKLTYTGLLFILLLNKMFETRRSMRQDSTSMQIAT